MKSAQCSLEQKQELNRILRSITLTPIFCSSFFFFLSHSLIFFSQEAIQVWEEGEQNVKSRSNSFLLLYLWIPSLVLLLLPFLLLLLPLLLLLLWYFGPLLSTLLLDHISHFPFCRVLLQLVQNCEKKFCGVSPPPLSLSLS